MQPEQRIEFCSTEKNEKKIQVGKTGGNIAISKNEHPVLGGKNECNKFTDVKHIQEVVTDKMGLYLWEGVQIQSLNVHKEWEIDSLKG